MHRLRPKVVAYDTVLMEQDMALHGWLPADLARHAHVSDMTVSRFLNNVHRTERTAAEAGDRLGVFDLAATSDRSSRRRSHDPESVPHRRRSDRV